MAGLHPELWEAASQGRMEQVRKLLSGAEVAHLERVEERGGWKLSSPLHAAALQGDDPQPSFGGRRQCLPWLSTIPQHQPLAFTSLISTALRTSRLLYADA